MKRGETLFVLFAALILAVLVVYGVFNSFPSTIETPVLSVLCFQGYTEPEWVTEFEKQHHCQVRITYATTIEEMLDLAEKMPEAFNLISIDSGRVGLYNQKGMLQPIETQMLKNYQGIENYFRTQIFSRSSEGKVLHVPIVWGTQTLTINTNKVPMDILKSYLSPDSKMVSLGILADKRLKGRTSLFDEGENVFAVSGIRLGVSDPHNLDAGELTRVEEVIELWMSNLGELTTGLDSEFNALSSGRVWILLGGNDSLLQNRLSQAGLGSQYLQLPASEGTYCWIDGWVMTKMTSGIQKELAYAYIDMMISEQGQDALQSATGFGRICIEPRHVQSISFQPPSKTYWYHNGIKNFPGKLIIMSPEISPRNRSVRWQKIKSKWLSNSFAFKESAK